MASLGIAVTKRTRPTEFPVQIAGRYLVDQHVRPFLVNGCTNWYCIDQFTQEETRQYLDDRKARGFNAVIMQLMNTYTAVSGAPANAAGNTPFITPNDFSTPREAYFAHVDWVLARAEERGIAVFLWVCYLGYQMNEEGWGAALLANSVANCTGFGEYLGARYKRQHNIIWVHGGDVAAGDYAAMSRVDAIADGILATDTVRPKLHSAHGARGFSAYESYNRPWLDLNTTYSTESTALAESLVDYDRYLSDALPFFYVEGRYENEAGATAQTVRSQAYLSILTGSCGHFYGNCPMWHAGGLPDWCATADWQGALGSTGAQDMARLAAFFSTRTWQTLTPDTGHTVVTSGHSNAAVTASAALCLGYFPTQREIVIAMTGFSGTRRVRWFNPATAVFTEVGTYANTGTRTTTPPAAGDWVLVVEE